MIKFKSGRVLVTGISKELNATLEVPGDKSISHRAVMLGSLASGISKVYNLSLSRDNLATIAAFRKLGVVITAAPPAQNNKNSKDFVINGVGLHGLKEPKTIINTANSGTLTRLIAGILAGNEFFSVLSGDKYLNSRPMGRITEPLSLMGAKITGRENGNYPPIAIKGGKLKSIYYEMPVPSAQVKSCIMLAALFAEGVTVIYEKKATRDHTENFLKLQGCRITVENPNDGNLITVEGGGELKPFEITVPGDFSSAAFFIALGILHKNSEIIIKNVLLNEKRTGLLKVLEMMGANIEITLEDEKLEKVGTIKAKYSNLKGVAVPSELVSDMIDEFPIFAVIASFAAGITKVTGAKELRVKESDRIKTIVSNLSLFGVKIKELEDGFELTGNPGLIFGGNGVKLNNKGFVAVDSFGDHRIAMSMVILGLLLKNIETEVRDVRCIGTSFPGFFDILSKLIKEKGNNMK
ncbi:MAG: 3-phosphoshikimate 1-carboxyvinyltransferase [Deltaproteobacteria bacterium]|nr:3-phosphoshikimate 1-carboxyvinyltransferase [Deltaproteobacteria bacterium]MCL5880288.1 3-phosphoshikimate 1-carboxyvinyltransferase [Deltaproteobacteria bacterium]